MKSPKILLSIGFTWKSFKLDIMRINSGYTLPWNYSKGNSFQIWPVYYEKLPTDLHKHIQKNRSFPKITDYSTISLRIYWQSLTKIYKLIVMFFQQNNTITTCVYLSVVIIFQIVQESSSKLKLKKSTKEILSQQNHF